MSTPRSGSARLEALVAAHSEKAVVLCGSGVSSIPPSSVPSWWGLNAAVLDAVRDLALRNVLTSTACREAVSSLNADDVPIFAFSQVLSDAFAGRFWLDVLTVLDSDAVNDVQIALATMVADGRCHSIVTTNFDTLLEQACALTGVDLPVVVPGTGSTLKPDAPAIHKIHGCVRKPESMVDLLLDKGRGLDVDTTARLAAACRNRHLLVLGFSGEDFAINTDYLGLLANSALPHRVTWAVRPGSTPGAGATAFLGALNKRGVAVAIEEVALHDPTDTARTDTGQLLSDHARGWTERTMYPPTAALVLALLLRMRGSADEAAAVRAEVRFALPGFEQTPVQLASAPAAWALLGKEERGSALALPDFLRADQAMDRLDRLMAMRGKSFDGQALVEQRLLRAGIRQNAAVAAFHTQDMTTAEKLVNDALQILSTVPTQEAVRRRAGIRYQQALHALAYNDSARARILLENSVALAMDCGDVNLQSMSMLMLASCLRGAGDKQLAFMLDQQATKLATASTDAVWRNEVQALMRSGGTALASDAFRGIGATIPRTTDDDEIAAARASDDAVRLAKALLGAVIQDFRHCGGERLGQLLKDLELACDRSPESLYKRTVRALHATDPFAWPPRARFLLDVIALGLDQASRVSPCQVERLRILGKPFHHRPSIFAPYGYERGIQLVRPA